MSSPGIEPGPRPSQSRVRVRHTPRTTIGTGPRTSPPPGNRTRPCGFEGRRASATPAGKEPSALARSRTWSSTFGGSRAVPSHSKGSHTEVSNFKGFTALHRFHEFQPIRPISSPFFLDLVTGCAGSAPECRRHPRTRPGGFRHRAFPFPQRDRGRPGVNSDGHGAAGNSTDAGRAASHIWTCYRAVDTRRPSPSSHPGPDRSRRPASPAATIAPCIRQTQEPAGMFARNLQLL